MLLLVLLWCAIVESDTVVPPSDAALPHCSTDEEKQFAVTVPTNEPLGLRLSEKIEVLEFVADAQGRGRAVEASGLAEIGDRLIRVNNASLVGISLVQAVAALAAAEVPKILRFQTHDGRCLQPAIGASVSENDVQAIDAVVQVKKSAGGASATTGAVFDFLVRPAASDRSRDVFNSVDDIVTCCSLRCTPLSLSLSLCRSSY